MRAFISPDFVARLSVHETCEIRDTKIRGFHVRCRASGRHSYVLTIARGRNLVLGRVGEIEVDKVRGKALRLLADIAEGLDPRVAKPAFEGVPTWKDFIADTYKPWAEKHLGSADETIRRLTVTFRELDPLPINAITIFAIERWRTRRLESAARSTVNRDLDDAKAALARAVEWGLISTHPIGTIKRLKTDRTGRVRFLTADEETRLRDALRARDDERRAKRIHANDLRRQFGNHRRVLPPLTGTYTDALTPILLLAINTGCRRGEIFKLRWRDVDFIGARLTVVGPGSKSGQTRYVPLNSEALDVLRAWKIDPTRPGDLIFPSPRGGGRRTELHAAFTNLMTSASIENFTFHDCRHHFASRLVQSGVPLNTVRELLGHADLRMTIRYSHLAPEHHAEAVERLAFGGVSRP